MTAGLILAAGESRRMGSPKALLEYKGETFLDRLIGLFARYCSPVIAVLGAHQERVRAGIRRGGEALLVENPDFQLGQLSSMQCGLRAVPAESEGVLFTLADHPAVCADTLAALLTGDPSAPLRIPQYAGRRGHPIWFSRALIAEFLALPATSSAREVVTSHAERIAYIPVEDPGILADVDDPGAYAALLAGSQV
ncbi:MAG TPA: nucleotidyltransferase family protein [Bryobacteraceae bacterium]|nr:nucleotidyltransferase family protein [Bryobacteraceae bacterium]